MSLANVDIPAFSQQLLAHFSNQLVSSGFPPEEVQDNITIIEQFNNIAVGLLQGEPGIELPGTEQIIPWDEKTSVQGLTLFAEGVYHGMVKCHQLGIPSNIKKELLQAFAMDVYNQAKQVVASTYGQEHTPEFQLSHDQQVALINQAAGNALMYYINKHEQENGPIETGPVPVGPLTLPTVTPEVPAAMAPLPAAISPQPVRPKGETPHDKYGAVALLLTTLPASQRAKVLQQFNEEEKELITFYSYPQHIEQNLDLSHVEKHLKRFKAGFKQGGSTPKTVGSGGSAHQGLLKLAEQYPMEKLLSYVKDERPAVKKALEAVYHPADNHPLAPISQKGPQQQQASDLPSRIEDILYQHLRRRLEATPQRA